MRESKRGVVLLVIEGKKTPHVVSYNHFVSPGAGLETAPERTSGSTGLSSP